MMEAPIFLDRSEAGKKLAHALRAYKSDAETMLLALPRGGVPVAAELAVSLGLPMDLMLVRKLSLESHKELALGAIALGRCLVINENLLDELGLSVKDLDDILKKETEELKRRNDLYRKGRPPPDLAGQCVILVDDGVATGADMRAAIQAARKQNAARVVVAVPVAPQEALALLAEEADEVVCLSSPVPFFAVGQAYEKFPQLDDEDVLLIMERTFSRLHEQGACSTSEERKGESP